MREPPSEPPQDPARYDAEREILLLARTRTLLLAGSAGFALLGPTELLLGGAGARLASRLLVAGLLLGAFALSRTRFGARHVGALGAAACASCAVALALATALEPEPGPAAHVGLRALAFVAALFLPWRLRETALVCATIVLSYAGAELWRHGPTAATVAPLVILSATGAFTVGAAWLAGSAARRDLARRERLEGTHHALQELDQGKTRLIANVSHELRTPIALILGPVEAMLQEETDPRRRALEEAIAVNGRRLLRQVNQLLDVAAHEAGATTLELARVQLGQLVAELIAAALPEAHRRGLTLDAEGLDDLGELGLDRTKVESIVANLLSNAIKFSPPGCHVVVRARTAWDRVAIDVADDGPGVPADVRERIFERFHRGAAAVARETPGTGLGLSIARDFARLHGGELSLLPPAGPGAVFHLELPRRPVPASTPATPAPRPGPGIAPVVMAELRTTLNRVLPAVSAPADAPRLLVVDDHADLRAMLVSFLGGTYRVTTASNGQEALDRAAATPPDLIVSDVMMPGMDGIELCRRLRADARLAKTPVILATARAGTAAVVEGLDAGADDYVTKPFELRELRARIEAQLRTRRLERDLAERDGRLARIGGLASAIVHDLRNPLSIVLGLTEVARGTLREAGDPMEVMQDLGDVLDAGQRIEAMIRELLAFAGGRAATPRRQRLAARPFLEQALAPLARDLAGRGVRLVADVACAGDLDADPSQLRRAIENLIGNARDAARAVAERGETPSVWLSAREVGGAFELRVADNGPGLSDAAQGRLFESFATSGKVGGTGLGLATVRQVIEAHGGTVTAEAKGPEGGAVFTLTLPGAAAAAGEPRAAA